MKKIKLLFGGGKLFEELIEKALINNFEILFETFRVDSDGGCYILATKEIETE